MTQTIATIDTYIHVFLRRNVFIVFVYLDINIIIFVKRRTYLIYLLNICLTSTI